MTTNNSQIGNSQSTPSFEYNASQSNINLLLLYEIHITNKSTLQFNEINMIPSQMPAISNTSAYDNLTQRREVRRRREQRELLQQEQLQQQQHQRYYQQQNRQRRQQQHQWYHEPRRRHYSNFSERFDSFEESMDELDKEPLLEAYMWEKNGPKGTMGTRTNK
ncbi:unnamed protein product [Adineta steineri]|uniref:Uncharacterized protein n=1 Tax=Adineta steineri TaxID=433720 RepID=A0A815GCP1_9BILA|nr:unnamed protein product [Adineta steineri]